MFYAFFLDYSRGVSINKRPKYVSNVFELDSSSCHSKQDKSSKLFIDISIFKIIIIIL